MSRKPLKAQLKALKPALVISRPVPALPLPPPSPSFSWLMRDVQPLAPDNRVHPARVPPSPHPQPRQTGMLRPPEADHFASWFDEDRAQADFTRDGVPRDVLKKIRARHWPLAGRLDLHGLDRDAAEARLLLFLHRSVHDGARLVAVIHGQGFGSVAGQPVLRPMVRATLGRHPDVLAYCPAPPEGGGDGAIFVLLRRLHPAG